MNNKLPRMHNKIGHTVLGELWLAMDNCTVISKKEILYLGPFGLACWLWGTIFIDRKNVGESCQTINATAESIRLAKVTLRNVLCIIDSVEI